MYRLFDHTADIGIHVEAGDLNTLFAEAACGLFAIITAKVEQVRCSESFEIEIAGSDKRYLLVDWLSELLMAFELKGLLLCQFDVVVSDSGIVASAYGEPVDFSRHQLAHEVKAITYHGLRVESSEEGWMAEVVVDI